MASKTELCNLALGHLGSGKEIGNLETEKSQEAAACRRFFDVARDATLRDFPWPFATEFISLALVEQNPTPEWRYSYSYPTDTLKLHRILTSIRRDTRQSRAAYRIVKDTAQRRLIYTDCESAVAEVTHKEDDTSKYDPDFELAFSFRLAAYIAPQITSGDPFNMGRRALELYAVEISTARKNALNEEQPDLIPESEFIRVRE